MDSTINIMRGYVEPGTTINRTVLDATQFANVLSDHAEVWYVFRNPSREYLTRLRDWIIEAGKAAAKVMGCEVDVDFITGVWPRLINEHMGELIHVNMELVGPPKFDDKEKKFAKALQETYPKRIIPEGGFKTALDETLTGLVVSTDPPVGTTDNADVSWLAPMCELSTTTTPVGCPGHSWQSVASHGSSIAHKGLVAAAKILAFTAIDLMTKPEALKSATKEYDERKGSVEYTPAIPEVVEPTLHMHKKYQDEYRTAVAELNT
jgi:aminobenzoyl-glutamate utilization protein B